MIYLGQELLIGKSPEQNLYFLPTDPIELNKDNFQLFKSISDSVNKKHHTSYKPEDITKVWLR
jgi:hypothetical protein